MKRKAKKESKRNIEKNLKKTAKEALKSGLTPWQIVGIVLGSTVVAGAGTTTVVLAARDKEFYNAYKKNMRENPDYKPNWYEKYRGYPRKLHLEDDENRRIEQNRKRVIEALERRGIPIPVYFQKPWDFK